MAVVMREFLEESLRLGVFFPEELALGGETWALTWTGERFAVSVYTGACNSWGLLNGVLYGAGANGVYAMDTTDGKDLDEPFLTAVLLARNSLGTPLPKSLRTVFVSGQGAPTVGASPAGYGPDFKAGTSAYGRHVFPRNALGPEWALGVQGFTELTGLEVHLAILPRRRG